MNNLISKLFFAAGLAAYFFFLLDRGKSHAIPDYSQDVIVIVLLGILGHFAFERADGT